MRREFGVKLKTATAVLMVSVGGLLVWQDGSVITLCLLAALILFVLYGFDHPAEQVAPSSITFGELSPTSDSRFELHELQRTLCKLEIDLERDVDKLSATYQDIDFQGACRSDMDERA
jgi:hypothetical protein